MLWLVVGLLLCAASAQGTQEQDVPGIPTLVEDPFEGRLVESIEVEGARRYSEDRLRAALGLGAGDRYSSETVEQGVEYLWTLFQVRADIVGKIEEDGALSLRLIVVELPADLEPRFIGYDEIKLEKILEWTDLQDRRELYFHQVPRVERLILDGYRREGHFHVQVRSIIREPSEGDSSDMPGDVIFEIIEGPTVHVSEVVIRGNVSMPDTGAAFWKNGLKHLASTELAGPSLFDWSGKEFVEDTLRSDLVAMRNVYRDRGFLNAVVELDSLKFNQDRSRVEVHIIVDEGKPFRVTEVAIEALNLKPHPRGERFMPIEESAELLYPLEDLIAELTLAPGDIYVKTTVDADRLSLRDYYGADGYIDHSTLGPGYAWKWLEPELIFDIEKAEVKVIYRISQGRQLRIRSVLISGATHTRDHVIRRNISVDPGDLANMEEIISSLRRLNRLEYFSDERDPLGHRDPYFVFRTIPGEEGLVDIDFIVEEGRVVDFAISGGIDSNDGLFGILSLSMRNFDIFDLPSSFLSTFGEIYRKEAFHGGGQTLSIQISPGARRDQSMIRFVEPDIFGLQRNRWSFAGEFSIFDRIYDYDEEKRTTRRVTFGRQLGYDGSFNIGFASRDVKVRNVDQQVLLDPQMGSLTQQIGTSILNGVTFGVSYRDTDAAFNPKTGRIISWNNDVAFEGIGSDWDIYNSNLSWDEYFKLGTELDPVPSSVRLSSGLGLAMPFSQTDVTPYSERLFLGGFNSLRGFRYRGVGPNSTDGNVLGGESMARASLEYRYPLVTQTRPGTYQEIEMFRVHFFVDAGVLGTDYTELDLDEMRSAAGLGFALLYPIPISFNFGWPLEAKPYDERQVFSFNIATR
jgi:outer membrane protein insertion porin family